MWERLVVAVDRVLALDEHGTVDRTWRTVPGEQGLYEQLVLAGVLVGWNPEHQWPYGHADTITLDLAPTTEQVVQLDTQ